MRIKSEARRQAIIEAAAGVFRDVGYELASMAEISARVGGSKATLYSYFSSKEVLFTAVIEHLADQALIDVDATLHSGLDMEKVLVEYGHHYLTNILSQELLGFRRMVQHEAGRSGVGEVVYRHGIQQAWSGMVDYLDAAMATSHLRKADPWVAAMHLKGLYEAELADAYLLGVPEEVKMLSRDEVVKRAVKVFLAAYGL